MSPYIDTCYTMMDLGPIEWLLGIQVGRDQEKRTIALSQESYINSILARFNFTDAKPLFIPMDLNVQYSKMQCPTVPEDIAKMRNIPYREVIGLLMYTSVATRPDISFAVLTLLQFLNNLGWVHWEAVKSIFRYLLGTKSWGLTYVVMHTGLTYIVMHTGLRTRAGLRERESRGQGWVRKKSPVTFPYPFGRVTDL